MDDDNSVNEFDTDIDFEDGTQEVVKPVPVPQLAPRRVQQARPVQAQQQQQSQKQVVSSVPRQPPIPRMREEVEPLSAPQSAPPQRQEVQTPRTARFIPYEIPKKIGLLDRQTGQPVIEDEEMLRVIMAQLADIKNDLEEIKSFYA